MSKVIAVIVAILGFVCLLCLCAVGVVLIVGMCSVATLSALLTGLIRLLAKVLTLTADGLLATAYAELRAAEWVTTLLRNTLNTAETRVQKIRSWCAED